MENLAPQESSKELDKLFEALAKAQSQIKPAKKNRKNPHYKSEYADLVSVWHSCRGPLNDNGLTVIQQPKWIGKDDCILVTILGHSSGQWIRSECPLINVKRDMQGLGSAITYAKRYCITSMIGIPEGDEIVDDVDTDDDGETACQKPDPKVKEGAISPTQHDVISEILNSFDKDTGLKLYDRILLGAGVKSLAEFPASKYKSCLDFLEKELTKINTKEQG